MRPVDNFEVGSQTVSDSEASKLALPTGWTSSTNTPMYGIEICNLGDPTVPDGDLYVGHSDVNGTKRKAIKPGTSFFFPVSNLQDIYLLSSDGDIEVDWVIL